MSASRRGIVAFVCFVAVAVVAGIVAVRLISWDQPLTARQNPESEDAYAEGEYTPLSPRVAGYLRQLDVDDNQYVTAGQPIAHIVDDDYRASLAQAEAARAAAQAQLQELVQQQRVIELQVQQSGAQAAGTRAEQRRAGEEAARQAVLLPTAMGLRRAYDNAAADHGRLAAQARAQDAQTEQAARQIDVLRAQQQSAIAAIAVRQAQVDLAQIRLGYTVLRAPVDGTLATRQVRVGTLLQPGTLVVALTPLDSVWVTANFTERQLTHIVPGQAARVRFDTFPDVELAAHVAGISPLTGEQLSAVTPDNSTGNYTKVVQRIPVKLTLDPGNGLRGRIRPGMSALVRVLTDGSPAVRPAR